MFNIEKKLPQLFVQKTNKELQAFKDLLKKCVINPLSVFDGYVWVPRKNSIYLANLNISYLQNKALNVDFVQEFL